jgi:hypothetical protein
MPSLVEVACLVTLKFRSYEPPRIELSLEGSVVVRGREDLKRSAMMRFKHVLPAVLIGSLACAGMAAAQVGVGAGARGGAAVTGGAGVGGNNVGVNTGVSGRANADGEVRGIPRADDVAGTAGAAGRANATTRLDARTDERTDVRTTTRINTHANNPKLKGLARANKVAGTHGAKGRANALAKQQRTR